MWEIFDASLFMPRGQCGAWSPIWRNVYMLANVLIFAAYMIIPMALVRFRFVRILGRMRKIRVLVAAFILTCGIGHLEGVVSFWWPAYHVFALWNLITAGVSWATVITLLTERVPDELMDDGDELGERIERSR